MLNLFSDYSFVNGLEGKVYRDPPNLQSFQVWNANGMALSKYMKNLRVCVWVSRKVAFSCQTQKLVGGPQKKDCSFRWLIAPMELYSELES